ncbi:MAG: hypothetical protein IJT74_04150 [Bacteroidales bacterium]|nr:hypothetical protein [Bacteroidales bacterium]
MDFKQFILDHEGEDLGALALARGRYEGLVEDFDLALTTLEVRRKLRGKVPEWYAVPSLQYPFRISGEQCSSSETAFYKASVAAAAVGSDVRPLSAADLTGGLGVDTWAFARVFDRVLYNEMRPELADAASKNFATLGLSNVQVSSRELQPGNLADILGPFQPSLIFLDPARRASDGRKVFRLEDCQPDVLQLLPELLAACPHVLLKLSPMADITLVCKQLGSVKEVHVVAADGECKELLLLLERDWTGPYQLTIFENGHTIVIPDGREGDITLPPVGTDLIGTYLFEPGKALLKAGAFELPCEYGLQKLGKHTHLYVGEEIPEELKPFGKCFKMLEAVALDKRSLRDLGKRFPQAEVTARNIPLTSDQLRARLGVKSGGSVHIFGAHVDSLSAHCLFVCSLA